MSLPLRLALCMTLVFSGCQRTVSGPLAIGGAEAVSAIQSADSVSASRLVSNHEYRPAVSDYEVDVGPITLSPAVRDRLREVFLNLRTKPSSKKACLPDFRIRLHFDGQASEVDILLCLECRIMAIYHNSAAFTCDNFDDVAPELIAISREIFPEDPAIQALR